MIIYGKGVPAIAEDLNVTVEKAQEIKDSVLKAFPDLANYLINVVEKLKVTGFVETLYGRKRRLPDIFLADYEYEFPKGTAPQTVDYYTTVFNGMLDKCKWFSEKQDTIAKIQSTYKVKVHQNGGVKAKAIREAYNAPVQGTSADITKIAMISILNSDVLNKYGAFLTLSIHDECIINAPIEHAYECAKELERCMLSAGSSLKASLRCDLCVESVWGADDYFLDNETKNIVKRT